MDGVCDARALTYDAVTRLYESGLRGRRQRGRRACKLPFSAASRVLQSAAERDRPARCRCRCGHRQPRDRWQSPQHWRRLWLRLACFLSVFTNIVRQTSPQLTNARYYICWKHRQQALGTQQLKALLFLQSYLETILWLVYHLPQWTLQIST